MPDVTTPYTISIPDAALARVRAKLAAGVYAPATSFTDDWAYGAPRTDVQRLAARWRDGFDWRAAEARLNAVPQFRTRVAVGRFGDVGVHFVHVRSARAGGVPLLFVHGWPGSFIEVLKMLPLLTEPADGPSFHVVAPSLPNFGFSDGVADRGFGIPQYAEAMHKVMLALGYDRYVTQGGDWGSIITRQIGIQYPSHCLASHFNFIIASDPASSPASSPASTSPAERAGLARTAWFRREGSGYNLEQSTRPHTLGFALADSPLALLAWIYEKLHDWTDGYAWDDDEVLTWVCIYQFSVAGPAASVRIYYENMHQQQQQMGKGVSSEQMGKGVLLGYSIFPRDLVVVPDAWARAELGSGVVFGARHDDGGHFAAWERPEQLVGDLRRMFGRQGGAESVTRLFAPEKARM